MKAEIMASRGIVIVGLGPAGANYLTREAWEWLNQAGELYLRSRFHPVVGELPGGMVVRSFEEERELEGVDEQGIEAINKRLLALGQRPEGVTYGVSGSPFIAEETVPALLEKAAEIDLPVRVIDGVSFLGPVLAALKVDTPPNLALVDALHLQDLLVPDFSPSRPALIVRLDDHQLATEVKLTLMAAYPDEYPVKLVHAAGTTGEFVEEVPLYAIDQSVHLGSMSSLYIPAREMGYSFEDLLQTIATLRSPVGCPWDREQTHQSLRPYLLEEAYEVLDALDHEDSVHLEEELGDLLLQIVLHAQIATEDEDFKMNDVIHGINAKLVRRHPHVFGEVEVDSVDNVLSNWEKIKAGERAHKGTVEKGMLEGIPLALPALTQADQIQRRAKHVGFDWPTIKPVIDKVHEELGELRDAQTDSEREAEAGDVLFAVVNLLRWLGIDPETALRGTNLRFRRRFGFIEAEARRQGKSVEELGFEEMDALWEAAKLELRGHEDEDGDRQA